MGKFWLKSKTIIANGVLGVIAPWIAVMGGEISPEVAISTSVMAAVNIVLRCVTTQPITISNQP